MDLCLLLLVLVNTMMAAGDNTTMINTTETNSTQAYLQCQKQSTEAYIIMMIKNMLTNLMPTNTTQMPPQCQNGGHQINGFCLCPDDFTGDYCELSNFCPEQIINNFTFPKTTVGLAGYSKEPCAQGNNAGFPRATALCRKETHNFTTPQVLDCSLTLNTIDTDLSNASTADMHRLASNTQILTSIPDKMTTDNISTAAKIVTNLLGQNYNQDIYFPAIITVSQLLNTRMEQFDNITTNPINNLTQMLPLFSLMHSDQGLLNIVQPNIAIQSLNLSNSSEIRMTLYSGLNIDSEPSGSTLPSDTLSANYIKLDFNPVSEQFTTDFQVNIKLNNESGNTSISMVLYNNDLFFRSQLFHPLLEIRRRVFIININNDTALEYVQITVTKQNTSSMSFHDLACVFWDYGKQDWSTERCRKVWDSRIWACKCTTANKINFAMLMSFQSNPEFIEALNMISIIGCSLSVAGLIITGIFQILTRKTRRSNPTFLMVNICVSMTIVYLLFLFGIQNPPPNTPVLEDNVIPDSDVYQQPDYGPCTVFTALLHYFLLATFTWNTLFAVYIFLLFKSIITGPPQHFPILSSVVGWGLPAAVVGITLGITYRVENPLNYRQEAMCWLAALDENKRFEMAKPMLWGFLLPVAVMLFFNMTVLCVFACFSCRTNPNLNSSQIIPLRNKMLSCVSMAVVLGVSWVIGYFLLMETKPIMQTILSFTFCLCNTTQGVQIFVFFTLRTRIFRKKAVDAFKLIQASGKTQTDVCSVGHKIH